eukprot:TRINITY_DN34118_c0_g1_i2.p1 TRINITY_DN34118_c0_g1~~TRINITY_DN34118_c0_g1_i2.p1  ORF type:complete len:101 (+),score=11.25 TRINITY_DN34118_c0_g1_i2:118-420(+)
MRKATSGTPTTLSSRIMKAKLYIVFPKSEYCAVLEDCLEINEQSRHDRQLAACRRQSGAVATAGWKTTECQPHGHEGPTVNKPETVEHDFKHSEHQARAC